MKRLRKECLVECIDIQNITKLEQKMLSKAKRAADKAYAPFSNFKVGAVLLLENGEQVEGSNQENAAYPSGMCAERVACYAAGANYPLVAVESLFLAFSSQKDDKSSELLPPCGACLQALLQLEIRHQSVIKIYILVNDNVYIAKGVKQFLPFNFRLNN